VEFTKFGKSEVSKNDLKIHLRRPLLHFLNAIGNRDLFDRAELFTYHQF